MVDLPSRRLFAQSIQQLMAGAITNREFDKQYHHILGHGADPALQAIYARAIWPLYCDMREHKLQGGWALSAAQQADVERCVLFLCSALPYKWPVPGAIDTLKQLFLSVATLGASKKKRCLQPQKLGDVEVWPFFTHADHLNAMQQHLGKEQLLLGSPAGHA